MFSLIVFTSSYEYQDHKEVGQKRKRIPEEDGVEGSRGRGGEGIEGEERSGGEKERGGGRRVKGEG